VMRASRTIRDIVVGSWSIARSDYRGFSRKYRRREAWTRLVVRGSIHRHWHDYPIYEGCVECRREVGMAEMRRRSGLTSNRQCVACEQPFTQLAQVGRCVYAEPCGHRQWQGFIPENAAT
jgi:hypothetical protein